MLQIKSCMEGYKVEINGGGLISHSSAPNNLLPLLPSGPDGVNSRLSREYRSAHHKIALYPRLTFLKRKGLNNSPTPLKKANFLYVLPPLLAFLNTNSLQPSPPAQVLSFLKT